jgi:hypothetical protein
VYFAGQPTSLGEAWARWRAVFEASARAYKKKHGKAPTLIIDSVSRLTGPPAKDAKEGALALSHEKETARLELLGYIQDQAKDWADGGVAKIVFVPSTGRALMELQGQLLVVVSVRSSFEYPFLQDACYQLTCFSFAFSPGLLVTMSHQVGD